MTTTTTTTTATRTAERFTDRVFESALGALDIMSIYVGDKLGLYAGLAAGSTTRDALAANCGVHWRYVGEWLEQQSVSGLVEVDDPTQSPDTRTYRLHPAHAEVLLDGDSLAYLAPFVRIVASSATKLPQLLEAYRNGGGVSWAEFGADTRSGQAEMNRPHYLQLLGTEWFPSVPSLHARLQAGGRLADVACGEGWSSIALALAYPDLSVDGYDIDPPSIEQARRNAENAGVADRVDFQIADVATLAGGGEYDVVVGFEFVHDLPAPIDVLSTMRRLVKPDGHVVVMDERVGERFTGEVDDVERLMYGFSMFVCLPDAMSQQPSAATGTVIRPSVMDAYAKDAGFAGAEILPIENDLWRFYRLSL
jgi:SAM-dependent methyltransferase